MPSAAPHEHDALPAGTRLGEFELECVLGVGGFGIVYRALDHALERRVALKEYMPAALAARGADARVSVRSAAHLGTFELGLRSFINEARLLARFDHPSLVKVYRFWEANDTAYMVMPWYEGTTLREARRTMAGPPSEDWLRSLIDPLLGALQALHREQVFHRDVAPDNILLLGDVSGEGQAHPVLLDFGAARHVISDHTQALTAILKPSFAPIEQYGEAASLRQGPWTDLYALAAVVYFCITGRAPMPATTRTLQDELAPLAGMAQALQRDFGRTYPPGLLAAVDHALAVRPGDRPQSVDEWRHELNASRWPPAGKPRMPGAADDDYPRTVVVDPMGRRTMDATQADPSAYATTAAVAAPRSALLARQDARAAAELPATYALPGRATTLPAASDDMGQGFAATSFPATLPQPVGGGTRVAPGSADADALRRPGRWMTWALAAMVGVTVWALWQARQARHHLNAGPVAAVVSAAKSSQQVAQPASVAASKTRQEMRAEARAEARAERERTRASSVQHGTAHGDRGNEGRAQRVSRAEAPSDSQPDDSGRASSPASGLPRAQCGGKVFIALAVCMKRVCAKPEFYPHAQCVRFREMEEANRPQRS